MKLPRKGTTIYVVGFLLFLVVFAYVLLNYTRRVEGTSMLPTLEEGDLVVAQGVQMSDVNIGDVIVYDYPCSTSGFSVIHRVVGTQGGGFITKGDNNPSTDQASGIADSVVTSECLAGRVVFVIPYVERLASLPYGTNYLLALLIIFIVLYSELRGRTSSPGTRDEATSVKDELTAAGPTEEPLTLRLLYTLYIVKEFGRERCPRLRLSSVLRT